MTDDGSFFDENPCGEIPPYVSLRDDVAPSGPRRLSLLELAAEARENSERWFPTTHDAGKAAVPLAVHYALGLCGEVGEVGNLVKKALRKGRSVTTTDMLALGLAEELADVFIYLMLLADEVGVDLEAAYEIKRDHNEKRWGN